VGGMSGSAENPAAPLAIKAVLKVTRAERKQPQLSDLSVLLSIKGVRGLPPTFIFRAPLGSLGDPKSINFRICFDLVFRSVFGPFWPPFWSHFGLILVTFSTTNRLKRVHGEKNTFVTKTWYFQ
jgi:hypothetical protein